MPVLLPVRDQLVSVWRRAVSPRRIAVHGVRLDVSSPAIDVETRHGLYAGGYQRQKIRQLGAMIEPNDTFLDIGAGSGLTALFVAPMVGDDNVVAVEADPQTAAVARGNFALNKRVIELLEGAAAIRGQATRGADEVDFYPNATFGASACFPRAGGAVAIRVPRIDFAGLLAERHVTAVNLDAPGSEYEIVTDVDDFASVRVMLLTIGEQAIGYPNTVALTRHLFDHGFAFDLADSRGHQMVFIRMA